MAKWQEQEDGSERDFSIVTLAQRLVSKRVRKASLYTPRGQEKALGLMPSVGLRERAQISKRGVPQLGFEAWIHHLDG